jgi:prepilin-type N-terminal cleavage/methylation domain-containing protein
MTLVTGSKLTQRIRGKGFSLVEIVLVLGLIAIASSIVIANFASFANKTDSISSEEALLEAVRFARFTAAKNVPGTESASLVSASAKRGGSVQVARRPKAARTTARVQIMVAVQEPTARACLGGPVLIAHSPPRSNAQKGAMAMVSAK